MLKRVNETRNPIIITQNGEAKAVLLDTESYQSMINSMGILKVLSQSENDIEKNNLHTQENMFSELDKKIKELSKSQ
jgi:prevent-host-death family protein